jgi:hypothetical protein
MPPITMLWKALYEQLTPSKFRLACYDRRIAERTDEDESADPPYFR